MNTNVDSEEHVFIRKTLAAVEKAERFERIKQVVVTVLAFGAAFWLLGSKGPSSELNIECTILIMVGMMLAVCTTKILSSINRNTKAVLQAIAAMQEKRP
jgi:hypothetical protein